MRGFSHTKKTQKGIRMKETKLNVVTSKINNNQLAILDKLIEGGKAKTRSSAIQYLINQYAILQSKGENHDS